MAREKKLQFNYDELTEWQQQHIKDFYERNKKLGQVAGKSFEEYVNDPTNNWVLDKTFITPQPQITSYGNKYTIRTAREPHHTELMINNDMVTPDEFENNVDTFEQYLYTSFEGIANIRYHPQMTYSQNIFRLDLPTDEEYEEMSEMDIDELIAYVRENFGVDIYYSKPKK